MSDLLELLGDEWTLPDVAEIVPEARRWSCKHPDRDTATHGCRESGRAPLTWSDVYGAYVDGMGRIARCGYCVSCIGSGRTSVRDPWTDELVDYRGAPCRMCSGTGWTEHAWDCNPDWHRHHMTIRVPEPATAFGVTFDGRTVVPGEYV
ncbi:hypothetical protein [Microbacterium immunditiarum]|uniref:Uncharacterized protein n=1 Tax=Microbacterium immunditiarum TaxID=337480 RepID=A0A7Y9GPZ6_9MICO|nr:hypothetical protein [Microbacterium immunditiarum]NYE20522.1 hypothetical protein [Microbacterium immunditiarum]